MTISVTEMLPTTPYIPQMRVAMDPIGIVCLGMNHCTAPIELRERLCQTMQEYLHSFNSRTRHEVDETSFESTIAGMAVLSTCNRLELYMDVQNRPIETRANLVHLFAKLGGTTPDRIEKHLYFHSGWDAIYHLNQVACGLDSLVLGEPQILGQVTAAYVTATENGVLTPALSAAFRRAIRAGKRARNETEISVNPASVSSVAVCLVEEIMGSLTDKHVVVVGAGEMGQLTVKALHTRGVKRVSIVNRTVERAERLAAPREYEAFGIGQLASILVDADVAICATMAPHPILDATVIQQVMTQRSSRKLVLVDIAVPRDIQDDVLDVPQVHLFDMDDLSQTLDETLAAREREIPAVKKIIEEEIVNLADEYQQMSVTPVIIELRVMAETIRKQEFERTRRFLGDVDDQTLEHVQHLSQSLVNKLLHEPTVRLKEKASSGQAMAYAAAVRDLFGLPDPRLH